MRPMPASWERAIGLDLQAQPTASTCLRLAFNPDFAAVEADQFVFNLTVDELFLPERRPFFIEGTDLFSTPTRLLYTRRIGVDEEIGVAGIDWRLSSTLYACVLMQGDTGNDRALASADALGPCSGQHTVYDFGQSVVACCTAMVCNRCFYAYHDGALYLASDPVPPAHCLGYRVATAPPLHSPNRERPRMSVLTELPKILHSATKKHGVPGASVAALRSQRIVATAKAAGAKQRNLPCRQRRHALRSQRSS